MLSSIPSLERLADRQRSTLTVCATELRRRATVLKDSAKERVESHKRKCLLCANTQANGEKSRDRGALVRVGLSRECHALKIRILDDGLWVNTHDNAATAR